MNKFIVRTKNVTELEKVAIIEHKAKFLDIVIIDTELSKEQIEQVEGVYGVEFDEKFELLAQ